MARAGAQADEYHTHTGGAQHLETAGRGNRRRSSTADWQATKTSPLGAQRRPKQNRSAQITKPICPASLGLPHQDSGTPTTASGVCSDGDRCGVRSHSQAAGWG